MGLVIASYQGNLKLASYLIKKGANVNQLSGIQKKSPLLFALEHGAFKLVALLLSNGADIKVKDCNGNSVVDYAYELLTKGIEKDFALITENQVFRDDCNAGSASLYIYEFWNNSNLKVLPFDTKELVFDEAAFLWQCPDYSWNVEEKKYIYDSTETCGQLNSKELRFCSKCNKEWAPLLSDMEFEFKRKLRIACDYNFHNEVESRYNASQLKKILSNREIKTTNNTSSSAVKNIVSMKEDDVPFKDIVFSEISEFERKTLRDKTIAILVSSINKVKMEVDQHFLKDFLEKMVKPSDNNGCEDEIQFSPKEIFLQVIKNSDDSINIADIKNLCIPLLDSVDKTLDVDMEWGFKSPSKASLKKKRKV